MEITWFGHSCFRLVERGLASVVTDPYDASLGYPTLRLKADISTSPAAAPAIAGMAGWATAGRAAE